MRKVQPFQGWFLFFCGICMGAADLIPGFSGGTLAFIFGFYEPLLASLQTFNRTAFRELFRGKWNNFCDRVEWRFLLTLLSGVLCSIVCFAQLFHYILSHELYRTYLYAVFLGFVLASFFLYVQQIQQWTISVLIGFLCGTVLGFLLSDTALIQNSSREIEGLLYFSWLTLCGALAICALLLPGISGSYVLMLLGVYPTVISALVEFTQGLQRFEFHSEAFAILLSISLGVILGGVSFAKVLSYFLRSYPSLSIATLCGFLIGAVRSVWPFWIYQNVPSTISKSAHLVPVKPYFPDSDLWLLCGTFVCALSGLCMVFVMNYLKYKNLSERIENSTQTE